MNIEEVNKYVRAVIIKLIKIFFMFFGVSMIKIKTSVHRHSMAIS